MTARAASRQAAKQSITTGSQASTGSQGVDSFQHGFPVERGSSAATQPAWKSSASASQSCAPASNPAVAPPSEIVQGPIGAKTVMFSMR